MNKSDRITKTKVVPPEIKKAAEVDFDFALDRKKPFIKRVRNFLTGEKKLGRKIGRIVDFATVFIPYGRTINTGRDVVRSILTEKNKPMLQKVLSIKNFVNVRDEDGNFSWEELVASVTQLGIAFGIVYGVTELGLWDEFMKLLESQG